MPLSDALAAAAPGWSSPARTCCSTLVTHANVASYKGWAAPR